MRFSIWNRKNLNEKNANQKQMQKWLIALLMGFILTTAGCASDDTQAPLSIIGVYTDGWGGEHTITADDWTIGYTGSDPSVFAILSFDNTDKYVIAQNDVANTYSPELFSRFDWTEPDGALYYCQTAYAAETEQAAMDTVAADATDLTTGCGSFPWSELTAQ